MTIVLNHVDQSRNKDEVYYNSEMGLDWPSHVDQSRSKEMQLAASVLHGESLIKFFINGKHVRAKKPVRGR